MKKLLLIILTQCLYINFLAAKTNLEYIQSRSHVDLTISHSFHGKLQITHLSGPLKLKSNIMPSLGFAVKYDYYFHKNIYGIIGFAYENIPMQFSYDFGTYVGYYPEDFKNYGFEKNHFSSRFFFNRSFPVGVGTTLNFKNKEHMFLELILNNVINGDRIIGPTYHYTYYGKDIDYFDSWLATVGKYKYAPEFGFNIGYAKKLRSGDFFKMSILANICLTPTLEGEYFFMNVGKDHDSYGLIDYKNNFWAIQMSYTLNYKRIKKVKRISEI